MYARRQGAFITSETKNKRRVTSSLSVSSMCCNKAGVCPGDELQQRLCRGCATRLPGIKANGVSLCVQLLLEHLGDSGRILVFRRRCGSVSSFVDLPFLD